MAMFGTNNHRNELDVPPPVQSDSKAIEMARIWASKGQQVVTLRPDLWEDPAAWGIMLVDFANHVANAYEQMGRGSKEEVLKRIFEGMQAEISHPTDEVTGEISE